MSTATDNRPDANPIEQEYDDRLNNIVGSENKAVNPAYDPSTDSTDPEHSLFRPGADSGFANGLKNKAINKAAEGVADKAAGAAATVAGDAVAGPVAGKALSWLVKHRKSAGGGAIGLFITGFIFLGFTTLSGPMQFMHIAELMKGFHLQEGLDQSDSRFGKMARLYRLYKNGEIQDTRLGHFANKYADKIDARLSAQGIESSFTEGKFNGYLIDPSVDGPYKGMSDAEIKDSLKNSYGVDAKAISQENGKFLVSSEKSGFFAERRMTGGVLKSANMGGVTGAIKARVLTKRAGVTFLPFRKLDQKITAKTYGTIRDKILKRYTSTVDNGALADPKASVKNEPAADGKDPAPSDVDNAKNNATQANEGLQSSKSAAEGKPGGLKSFTGKMLGGGALLWGVLCIINEANVKYKEFQQTKVVLPLIRVSTFMVAAGDQAKFGGQGDNQLMAQMGEISKTYLTDNTKGNEGSWVAAESIQTNLGKPGTGIPASETMKGIGSNQVPFEWANNGPVQALCSGPVTVAVMVVSFATGPISTAVQAVLATGIMKALEGAGVMQRVADYLFGKPINVKTLKGPALGSAIDYGTVLSANQQGIAAGGAKLSDEEYAVLSTEQQTQQTKEFKSKSIAYRLFSPDTSRSMFGSLIDNQSPLLGANLSEWVSGFINIGSSFGSILNQLISPSAWAATRYNYGSVGNYGFSADEQAAPEIQDPYANALYVKRNLLTQPNIDKAKKCFGVTISPDGSNVDALTNDIINVYQDYDAEGCRDKGNINWLRIRYFIFDSQIADSASCYEGDNSSCAKVGFGSSTSAVTALIDYMGNSTGTLPTGSAQELANKLLPLIASGKISCNSSQGAACSDIQNTAQGTPIGGQCSVTALDPRLLGMLLELANMGHSFVISSICSDHDKGTKHTLGEAVDFNIIDGVFMGSAGKSGKWTGDLNTKGRQLDKDISSFMPKQTGFGQVNCHDTYDFLSGFNTINDDCHHQHVSVTGG